MPDDRDLAALAVLGDPQRRRVFERLERAPESTVAELAEALAIGRTLVTFHLGKLVEAGLVEVVAPRRRPGSLGRPSQRYRPSRDEVSVTVPARRYDLLADVLLAGLGQHQRGESGQDSAARAARARGAELAAELGRVPEPGLPEIAALLGQLGYAPAEQPDGLVALNCPFDRMRPDHAEQVCGVNLALAQGYLDGLGLRGRVGVRLSPSDERCCLVFEPAPG